MLEKLSVPKTNISHLSTEVHSRQIDQTFEYENSNGTKLTKRKQSRQFLSRHKLSQKKLSRELYL